MNKEIKEAFEAVDTLNQEFFAALGNDDIQLSLSTTGIYTTIDLGVLIPTSAGGELLTSELWSSQEDDRKYFEDDDKYESFYIYIRRRMKEIIDGVELLKKVL